MKKIYLFLLAAAGIFAAASCAVEEMTAPVEENGTGEVTTLTFAFDATKTALVNGKTTWTAGDKIRVYNSTGTFSQDIEVPEEGAGKAEFTADVNMADTLFYAAYPASAVKSFADGKITLSLATNPDGRFASANLCVAMTKGTNLQFHNATAVLKINVNSGITLLVLVQTPLISRQLLNPSPPQSQLAVSMGIISCPSFPVYMQKSSLSLHSVETAVTRQGPPPLTMR